MLPYILVIFFVCGSNNAEDTTFTINLNKTTTDQNKELFSSIINVTSLSTVKFDFENVNPLVSFIIFQAHSHLFNITMYNNTNTHGSFVTGTNVGLYSSTNPMDTLYIVNPNEQDLKILIAVHGYEQGAPVPGGCNQEFFVKTAPYLVSKLAPSKAYITVDGAAPMDPADATCDTSRNVTMEFYRIYLPERDFSIDTYFAGISVMMNLDSIKENGEKIPKPGASSRLRRTLSAYPGTGSVYVAVAETSSALNKTHFSVLQSVYVPIVNYGCSPSIEGDCELLGDLLSHILCASLLFVGLFVCYFGHRFFKTEMFIFGMLGGVIITYILISSITEIDHAPLMGASFLSGILFGCIWLTFWWFYGIPVLAVMLVTLHLGFLAASVLFHELPGGLDVFTQDMNFWTVFITAMLITAVTLLSATYPANILCCAILGAYAVVYPVDYSLGSSLKYLVINVVRRATVQNFKYAVLSLPFQGYDALLTLLWVTLATTGFLFQHFHNRGRSPFPPPPRDVRGAPEPYGRMGGYNTFARIPVPAPVSASPVIRRTNENTPLLA